MGSLAFGLCCCCHSPPSRVLIHRHFLGIDTLLALYTSMGLTVDVIDSATVIPTVEDNGWPANLSVYQMIWLNGPYGIYGLSSDQKDALAGWYATGCKRLVLFAMSAPMLTEMNDIADRCNVVIRLDSTQFDTATVPGTTNAASPFCVSGVTGIDHGLAYGVLSTVAVSDPIGYTEDDPTTAWIAADRTLGSRSTTVMGGYMPFFDANFPANEQFARNLAEVALDEV